MTATRDAKHTNRLIHETSPYLLQHAHNPVDWHPWGDEAFRKAREEDKPILLSVGYAACHWCHVMEHESFEDEAIAAMMNEHFVSVKVDREERPDVDALYMLAVQMLAGRGGWPMTVFLTPELKPFYGGTYYPPEDRHQMPGFPRVLEAVANYYHGEKDDLESRTERLTESLQRSSTLSPSQMPPDTDIMRIAYHNLAAQYDTRHGGFGSAPKFPQPSIVEFLFRYVARTRSGEAMEMIERTLQKMANGGLYDHLGGGFHRYSTD
ncbi:MAG: DUF255 domain-containing protein, partial [Candidatus Poribacteria bacterium]|nr:DUF255 domain-containing protein [Candidatus Poribacteria bacterium]